MSNQHDFDFFFGTWNVAHRRLRERLTNCAEWDEFTGTSQALPLLGGAANVDDNVIDLPDGPYRAVSLRTFDAPSQTWSIWWIDGRSPRHIDTPVIGGFVDGVGEFLAMDSLRGQPIVVRFRWTDTSTDTPTWEQSFSPDGGTTWERNWTMHFTRTSQ
jgi:hypothetical protein